MMRISVIAATLSFLLQVAFADVIPDRLERVKALSDEEIGRAHV